MGIDEGTVLAAEAAELGFETESFVVDPALAPRERDWVGQSTQAQALPLRLYFGSSESAEAARTWLSAKLGRPLPAPELEPERDWNAEWKKSFTGISVDPFWEVLPFWRRTEGPPIPAGRLALWINPGAGFGTGTHPTTALCLQLLAHWGVSPSLSGRRVLDFGSGSGILSVGAALLGAQSVIGVEIDELANENARQNAAENGVSNRVAIQTELPPAREKFEIVLANILRPVLLEFADELILRLAPGGTLILSGLVAEDVTEVIARFQKAWAAHFDVEPPSPRVYEREEWRAIAWFFTAVGD